MKNSYTIFNHLLITGIFLCSIHFVSAQDLPVRLGYYAPYGQFGMNVGTQISFKNWPADSAAQKMRSTQIYIVPQLGYYYKPNVQYNFMLQAEGMLVSQKIGKRFYPYTGIGLGYQLSFQKQEGTIHLGTGQVTHELKTIHQIVPTLNLGFGVTPKRQLGMYFKLFYGGRFRFNHSNDAFVGGEIGLTFHFKKNTSNE